VAVVGVESGIISGQAVGGNEKTASPGFGPVLGDVFGFKLIPIEGIVRHREDLAWLVSEFLLPQPPFCRYCKRTMDKLEWRP
jgi:hypothetical protein